MAKSDVISIPPLHLFNKKISIFFPFALFVLFVVNSYIDLHFMIFMPFMVNNIYG